MAFEYRQRKKEALKQAEKINPEKPKSGEIVRDIDENLFFLALQGVGGASTPESNFDDVKERAKETGVKGVGVVESKLPGWDDVAGKSFSWIRTCYSSQDYETALRELFRTCARFQNADGGDSSAAPTIITSTVEQDNLIVAYTYAVEP